ncbi:DUF177 domain-containing protein [Stomatohabitans albus]|uniref:YceD family protein n=1 Tax=Stomatohabitans albus TaxID=3110766 RepID=UPI00300D3500
MSSSEVLSSRIDVSALLETPGTVLPLQGVFGVPEGLDIPLITLPDTLSADLVAEGLLEGVLVRGSAELEYQVQCASCLQPGTGHIAADITELFGEDDQADEGFVIDPDQSIDLDPMWRDVIAAHTSDRYVCMPDCRGLCPTCGSNRNEQDCSCEDVSTDLRWQALAGLTFPDADEA